MSHDGKGRKPGAATRVSPVDTLKVGLPGKRTLTEAIPPQTVAKATHAAVQMRAPDAAHDPEVVQATDLGAATPVAPRPTLQQLFGSRQQTASPGRAASAVQRKELKDDAQILDHQARLQNTDVEIPALEGALLATRLEAVDKGLLSKPAFDASLALSRAMTQLQPAVAAKATVDVGVQVRAALAAQQLFMALQRETADDKNFHIVSTMGPGGEGGITEQNPYTEEVRVTTSFLLWSRTTESAGGLQRLPGLLHQGKWSDAFAAYRRLMDGLDLWVADQLRSAGKGTPDEARGNAHEHHAQLRTGLEKIAGKHATRLPALFHPDAETIAKEKAAGRPAIDAVPMNVYVWKDDQDGKYHLYDLTAPAQPHDQAIDGPPAAAAMATFFEEVARYPQGEVRYTLPGGTAGLAPTTGKIKWYEWLGFAGLAIAAAGLAFVTAGASVPATLCFAGGALAGGLSAGGHLADSVHLGTATTATVVLDVAQIAASFASFGAMTLTVTAGSAAAALAGSRYFVPLVGTAAAADSVQLVALTSVTFSELDKIQRGAGSAEDKQRAMAVLLTQLLVTGGLTVLSVQGARSARAMSGQPLELIEQNGANVLRVVGDTMMEPAPHAEKPATSAGHNASSRNDAIGPDTTRPSPPTNQSSPHPAPPTPADLIASVPDAVHRAVEARVQPQQIVEIFRAGGAAAIQDVHRAISLESNGRLRGLDDWLAFANGKAPGDLLRTLGELSEAQRLARANPQSVINIGGDRRAPARVSDPAAAMPSFDITVETLNGRVSRSVEVTTIDAPVSQARDITPGVRHAIDKVEGRARPADQRDANPISGDHDVTIRMTLAIGEIPIRGGRVRRIEPSGHVSIIDADGLFRARPGNPTNLYDDIAKNLEAVANNKNLSRVTLVDQVSHAVLAIYKRTGTVWTRVPER